MSLLKRMIKVVQKRQVTKKISRGRLKPTLMRTQTLSTYDKLMKLSKGRRRILALSHSNLVQQIRHSDGSSTGILTKAWDFNEREAEFRDDLRQASGVGKRRGRTKGKVSETVRSETRLQNSVLLCIASYRARSFPASESTHWRGASSIYRQ